VTIGDETISPAQSGLWYCNAESDGTGRHRFRCGRRSTVHDEGAGPLPHKVPTSEPSWTRWHLGAPAEALARSYSAQQI